MSKQIIQTKDLYGVFGYDGSFKLCYSLDIGDGIQCLMENKLPKSTVIKEELGLYKPLSVYSIYKDEKIKSINWLNGTVFQYDDKYYKAIPFDIILNEFLSIKAEEVYETTVVRVERIMQKKLQEYPQIHDNIWHDLFISSLNKSTLPKKNERSIIFMERCSIIEFENIREINGMKALSRKYPNTIIVSQKDDVIRYQDTNTNETVLDKYNEKHELLNRLYYNSRSGAIVQVYYQPNEVIYFICGIKIKEDHLKNLFTDGSISNTEKSFRRYRKKHRIPKE